MRKANFQDLYCTRYRCLSVDYETGVLWHCLHSRALPLARCLWKLDRDYFFPDLELIRAVKHTTSYEEFKQEFNLHRYLFPRRGFLRNKFKVRISGQCLITLAAELFQANALPGPGEKKWIVKDAI